MFIFSHVLFFVKKTFDFVPFFLKPLCLSIGDVIILPISSFDSFVFISQPIRSW